MNRATVNRASCDFVPFHRLGTLLNVHYRNLRTLRIELGLSGEELALRARSLSNANPNFKRNYVSKAETKGTGLNSWDTRLMLSAGLGITPEQLDAFLRGEISPAEAVKLSSVKPDPEKVRALRARELSASDTGLPDELQRAIDAGDWSDPTVAAVQSEAKRAVAAGERRTVSEWRSLLSDVERGLEGAGIGRPRRRLPTSSQIVETSVPPPRKRTQRP